MKLFLLLLGIFQLTTTEYSELGHCKNGEDVKPPKYFNKQICYASSIGTTCDCEAGYRKDEFGDCTLCAEGLTRDRNNNCVHCPRHNERWCAWYRKCICAANFRRNLFGICVRCSKNEVSDGNSRCYCRAGFVRSTDGSCVKVSNNKIVDISTQELICYDWEIATFNKRTGKEECVCADGYERDQHGNCVIAELIDITNPAFLYAFVACAFLGSMCGYIIRKCKHTPYVFC